MKKFQFPLETVLHIRTEQLEKVRQAFAECAQWRARAANLVASAQAEIDACHEALTRQRTHVTNRTDQLLFLNALQYQQSLLHRHKDELGRIERELEIRRQLMMAAQRKLDAVERLKDRQLQAHRAAMQRAEDAMIDDLVSARYVLRATEVAA